MQSKTPASGSRSQRRRYSRQPDEVWCSTRPGSCPWPVVRFFRYSGAIGMLLHDRRVQAHRLDANLQQALPMHLGIIGDKQRNPFGRIVGCAVNLLPLAQVADDLEQDGQLVHGLQRVTLGT